MSNQRRCGGWGFLLGVSTAQLIGNYPLALDVLSIIILALMLIADIKATINSEKESK